MRALCIAACAATLAACGSQPVMRGAYLQQVERDGSVSAQMQMHSQQQCEAAVSRVRQRASLRCEAESAGLTLPIQGALIVYQDASLGVLNVETKDWTQCLVWLNAFDQSDASNSAMLEACRVKAGFAHPGFSRTL